MQNQKVNQLGVQINNLNGQLSSSADREKLLESKIQDLDDKLK